MNNLQASEFVSLQDLVLISVSGVSMDIQNSTIKNFKNRFLNLQDSSLRMVGLFFYNGSTDGLKCGLAVYSLYSNIDIADSIF